jgi:membrane protease YdiL (CAAX protease family)
MKSAEPAIEPHQSAVLRHPVAAFFLMTFVISWFGAFLVAAPHLIHREPLPNLTGILMFPAMLVGPPLSGIALTRIVGGQIALRDLVARTVRWRFPLRWYASLLIPPALILFVLLLLTRFVSPAYAPNRFLAGILFGVPAGLLEEIGWTGYAFPALRKFRGPLSASVALGLLWSLWHLPVINFLGTATPHGSYWLPFFLAFSFAMTAMRVLICWMYSHTGSVLLAQLMHTSSTGSLVIFSAAHVAPRQEVFWYTIYGIALWVAVGLLVRRMLPGGGGLKAEHRSRTGLHL